MNTLERAQINHDNAGPADEDTTQTRMFEGQCTQLETDLDYFGEELFEHELTDAEKYLIGRALDAYAAESGDVEKLRRRIAALNAEHMAKHPRFFS